MIFRPKFVADRNFWWQQKFIFWKVWTKEMRFAPSNASRTCFAAPLMVYAFGWYGDFRNFAIWPIGHFDRADIGRNCKYWLEIVVGDTLECKYPPELFPDALSCSHEIDWENARIVGREQRWTQRKYLEGIESLRQKNKGVNPLNNYNQLWIFLDMFLRSF